MNTLVLSGTLALIIKRQVLPQFPNPRMYLYLNVSAGDHSSIRVRQHHKLTGKTE